MPSIIHGAATSVAQIRPGDQRLTRSRARASLTRHPPPLPTDVVVVVVVVSVSVTIAVLMSVHQLNHQSSLITSEDEQMTSLSLSP